MTELKKCLLEINGQANVRRLQAEPVSFTQQLDRFGEQKMFHLWKTSLLTNAYHIHGEGLLSLRQENLETFLLMATEKEVLMEIDKKRVIDWVAGCSEKLCHLQVL